MALTHRCGFTAAVVFMGLLSNSLIAQGPNASTNGTSEAQLGSVPRLIQFSGVLKSTSGNMLTGIQGVIFGLYKEQLEGTPLWLETQNVSADEKGQYQVLLGAASKDGVPTEIFSSGESRWLGIQPQAPGEPEQPRVLLVSVPYALKAADADTLSGKPLSAFVLSPNADVGKATSSSDKKADRLPQASDGWRTRGINFIAGCDYCGVLADSYDHKMIFLNVVGTMTINSVTCFSDVGTPIINVARNGSPIISGDLPCSTNGTTTTKFTNDQLHLNDWLDFVMVSAGGQAHRATIAIKATFGEEQ